MAGYLPDCAVIMTQRSYSIPRELTRAAGGARLRVYVALAERCDNGGSCFPSLRRLAADAGVDRSTVARALTWLITEGWVTRQHRRNDDGGQRSSLFTLPDITRNTVVASVPPRSSETATGGSQNCDEGSRKTATRGGRKTATHNSSQLLTPLSEQTPTVSASLSKPRKRNEIFDASIDHVKTRWPEAAEQIQSGWAIEIGKAAKRSGIAPERLIAAAAAVLDLAGYRTIATVPNPVRSELVARLGPLVALQATPSAFTARWIQLTSRAGSPRGVGQRLDKLIAEWHQPNQLVPITGRSAQQESQDALAQLAEALQDPLSSASQTLANQFAPPQKELS
jgi:GntR family transcriptional regulator